MSTLQKLIVVLAVPLLFGLPMLFAGDGKPLQDTTIPGDVLPADIVADALADVAMSFSEDGKLELAGIVSVQVDDAGVVTVEVERNGDFDLDPVLVLNVPLFDGPDGQLLARGIQEIAFGQDTVVLTIGEQATEEREDVEDDCDNYHGNCFMEYDLDTGHIGCGGSCRAPEIQMCGYKLMSMAADLQMSVQAGTSIGDVRQQRRPLPTGSRVRCCCIPQAAP